MCSKTVHNLSYCNKRYKGVLGTNNKLTYSYRTSYAAVQKVLHGKNVAPVFQAFYRLPAIPLLGRQIFSLSAKTPTNSHSVSQNKVVSDARQGAIHDFLMYNCLKVNFQFKPSNPQAFGQRTKQNSLKSPLTLLTYSFPFHKGRGFSKLGGEAGIKDIFKSL